MVKILHIITSLHRGGAESFLYRLLLESDRSRYVPIVVSLTKGGVFVDQIKALGIPVYTLNMGSPISLICAPIRLARLVKKLDPDLIHAWMYHAILISLIVIRNRPVIAAIHSALSDLYGAKRLTRRIIYWLSGMSSRTAKIVYCSKVSRQQHEVLGYNPAKSITIPNGYDCNLFRPNPEARSALRKSLDIPDGTFIIGHLGRYHPIKDHKTLLIAYSELVKEFPKLCLVMAGSGLEYSNMQLLKIIRDLGIHKYVYLLGSRNDAPQVLAMFDLFVNTSKSEAFPNVLAEAMACEVPCVATNVGDSSYILGNTGQTVVSKDPSALASAIKLYIEKDPEERAELGRLARHRIVQNFSIPKIVEAYQSLYDRVLD